MQAKCGAKEEDSNDSKVAVLMQGSPAPGLDRCLTWRCQSQEGMEACRSALCPLVSNFLARNPELTSKDIATFPVFQHCIKLAPNAVPVAVKTQQVLYAIEGKVVDAVQLLGEQGSGEHRYGGMGPPFGHAGQSGWDSACDNGSLMAEQVHCPHALPAVHAPRGLSEGAGLSFPVNARSDEGLYHI